MKYSSVGPVRAISVLQNKLCKVMRSLISFHTTVPVLRISFEFALFILPQWDGGMNYLLLRVKCLFVAGRMYNFGILIMQTV